MAAGTIAAVAATPNSVVFEYTGANGTDSLTAAQVLAACAAVTIHFRNTIIK